MTRRYKDGLRLRSYFIEDSLLQNFDSNGEVHLLRMTLIALVILQGYVFTHSARLSKFGLEASATNELKRTQLCQSKMFELPDDSRLEDTSVIVCDESQKLTIGRTEVNGSKFFYTKGAMKGVRWLHFRNGKKTPTSAAQLFLNVAKTNWQTKLLMPAKYFQLLMGVPHGNTVVCSNMEGFPTKEATLDVEFQKDPVLIDVDGMKTYIDLNKDPQIFGLADDSILQDANFIVLDENQNRRTGASDSKLSYTEELNESSPVVAVFPNMEGKLIPIEEIGIDLAIEKDKGSMKKKCEHFSISGSTSEMGKDANLCSAVSAENQLDDQIIDEYKELLAESGNPAGRQLALATARNGKRPVIADNYPEAESALRLLADVVIAMSRQDVPSLQIEDSALNSPVPKRHVPKRQPCLTNKYVKYIKDSNPKPRKPSQEGQRTTVLKSMNGRERATLTSPERRVSQRPRILTTKYAEYVADSYRIPHKTPKVGRRNKVLESISHVEGGSGEKSNPKKTPEEGVCTLNQNPAEFNQEDKRDPHWRVPIPPKNSRAKDSDVAECSRKRQKSKDVS